MKAFINNFPEHIARYDKEFKPLYIKWAIENQIQMSAGQLMGKSNRVLQIPSNNQALDELENGIRFVFETGLPANYRTRHIFPDGTAL